MSNTDLKVSKHTRTQGIIKARIQKKKMDNKNRFCILEVYKLGFKIMFLTVFKKIVVNTSQFV